MSGFDPRGVAAYHRLYSDEAAKQAQLLGWDIRVGPRKRTSTLSSEWKVERRDGESVTTTTFEFLHWDDIVRRHWHEGFLRLYRLACKTYWRGIVTTGILFRLARTAKWPFVTGIAPALAFFVLPLLALAAGCGTYYALVDRFLASTWVATVSGAAVFIALCGLALWLSRELNLNWLLRSYAFTTEYGLGKAPELDGRIMQFTDRVARYLEMSTDDEVLIVGHSSGANMAVSLLARLLRARPTAASRVPAWALLTLGGSIPMQGLLDQEEDFRSELAFLNKFESLPWVDISAAEDVASFAALNPVHASGIPYGVADARRPRVLSGEFRKILTEKTYGRASWDLFRMHFQYLMAQEIPCENDYFSITTGTATFAHRFGFHRAETGVDGADQDSPIERADGVAAAQTHR
jgi:hypothetical protein